MEDRPRGCMTSVYLREPECTTTATSPSTRTTTARGHALGQVSALGTQGVIQASRRTQSSLAVRSLPGELNGFERAHLFRTNVGAWFPSDAVLNTLSVSIVAVVRRPALRKTPRAEALVGALSL